MVIVVELVIEDREVVEEDVKVVDGADIWEDRELELWLIVWLRPESPLAALLAVKTGAVFVLERGPWA